MTTVFMLLAINTTANEYMQDEFGSLNGLFKDTGYCEFKGKQYPYNTKIAMNREMLKIYKNIANEMADKSLVVLMQCKYYVDPLAHDHPTQSSRRYVWVAGQ